MREIKFRFWNKINRRMFYADKHGLMSNDLEQILFASTENQMNQLAGEWEDSLVIMQYAGLNDKRNDDDGTEIYDQDIASYDYDSASDPHGLHYSTDRGTVKGIVSWLEGGWVILDLNKDYVVDLWSGVYNCGVKVIGNIYEPPELLAGVK